MNEHGQLAKKAVEGLGGLVIRVAIAAFVAGALVVLLLWFLFH